MDLDKSNKILVIRYSSLGDVLLTTPVIRAVAACYPNTKIDFIVKRQFEDTLKYNPCINKLHVFDGKEPHEELIQELKSGGYDLVIDLQSNVRSKKLVNTLGVESYNYTKPTLKKFLLVNFKINLYTEVKRIPEMYADAIPGLQLDEDGLELHIPENILAALSDGAAYIGMCPGSKHYTKRWLPEYFVDLGSMLNEQGYTIVLFGGKDDKQICADITNQIPNCINKCNDDNLLQTAAGMKQCKAIVCNDSGMMHTASAVGVPLAVVFGSTVREFGFYPYNAQSLILENKSLSCRPCSHIGRSSCPKQHFKCMRDVTPAAVYENLIPFLAR